jgi:outer membrane protein OmpA-like peptidoglycan-associated protein
LVVVNSTKIFPPCSSNTTVRFMKLKHVNISRYVVLLGLLVYFIVAEAFQATKFSSFKILPTQTYDSLPKYNDSTVIIPFEYQQSSLNYSFTFRRMDSVANILLQDDSIKLSIDGYSYFSEGRANICSALALNRALCVKLYVQGRGIDSSRIITTEGRSYFRSLKRRVKNEPVEYNCTAEITLHYPIPPDITKIPDMDEDGIPDENDSCQNDYGYKENNGCPNKDAIIIPFKPQQSSLFSQTYKVMDSVIAVLRSDPSASILIEGHAYKKEGVQTFCDQLAQERADMVKRYLLTRQVADSRIEAVKSFSNLKPLNAGRNYSEIARNSRVEVFIVHH